MTAQMKAKSQSEQISLPAEWAPQRAIWMGWPSHPELWLGDMPHARLEIAAMARALATDGPDGRKGTPVKILACGDEAIADARAAVGDAAEIIPAVFGDMWMRDIGPVFAKRGQERVALGFGINGWGGKYDFPEDRGVAAFIAETAGVRFIKHDFILEAGSVEYDGEGTILTTRQCLLNDNRNGWDKAGAEAALRNTFGAEKILWLDEGMLNDHTDGHIDNIARFCAPGHVICQEAFGADDPNRETYNAIAKTLAEMTDAKGRKLKISRIPGPGLIRNPEDMIIAASHMNWIVGNAAVVIPTYGTKSADLAVKALEPLFPGRRIVGLSAKYIMGTEQEGGGAFHCMTQQEPEE